MGKITLVNIAEELVAKSGLTKEDADKFLHAFVETIEKGLRDDKMVKVRGLGTFKLMDVSDRGSVDVNTGERITLKGYTKVSFAPDSSMKEFVNRPFAHFEPVELNDGYPDEEVVVDMEESAEEATLPVIEEPAEPITEEVKEVAEVAPVEEVAPEASETPEVVETVEETEEIVIAEPVEASEVSEPVVTSEETESLEPVGPVEEVAEEPVAEEVVSSDLESEPEEPQELPSEEVAVVEEVLTAEAEENVSDAPAAEEIKEQGKKHSRRRGMGGIIVMLLVAVVAGVYYLTDFTIGDIALLNKSEQKFAEVEDIKVNPNLEQELGINRKSEPEVEEAVSEANTEVVAEEKQAEASEPVNVAAVPSVEESKPAEVVVSEAKPAAAPVAKTLVITEALAAKNVKDITVADTTEYTINGTQTTHKLQEGETIIQLARKYYGDKRLWPYIVKHNQITDFNKVAIGMSIDIPVLNPNTNQ